MWNIVLYPLSSTPLSSYLLKLADEADSEAAAAAAAAASS